MTVVEQTDAEGRDTPLEPEQLVDLALARAYATFAGHGLGATMVVRRPEVTPADVAALAGPVDGVTAAAIDAWLPHAATTWGDAEDLRALLPRVLDLLAHGALTTPPEVAFAKLRIVDAGRWPTEELAAIEDVVTAMWIATLVRRPARIGLPAWRLLVAVAELGGELSPFLDDWTLILGANSAGTTAARWHLQDLLDRTERPLAEGEGLRGLFWSDRPAEAGRLERWLDSPLTRRHAVRPS
jgi:hypothetical protein